MIFSVTNPTDFVDWSKTIHKMWSCSFEHCLTVDYP